MSTIECICLNNITVKNNTNNTVINYEILIINSHDSVKVNSFQ